MSIIRNKDGSLSFSKNATTSIIRVANALNLTEEGRKSLRQVIRSDIKVKINITDKSKIVKKEDGTHYTFGETQQGNEKPPTYGQYNNPDGTMGITEASIIIFEGTIIEDAKTKAPKHAGLNTEQAIGAVAGHEIVHATDKAEINKDLKHSQGKFRKDNAEAKPNKVESIIIDQSKKLNE